MARALWHAVMPASQTSGPPVIRPVPASCARQASRPRSTASAMAHAKGVPGQSCAAATTGAESRRASNVRLGRDMPR